MTDKGDEPMTDQEQRYRDLQAEFERGKQELAALKRRNERDTRQLANLGAFTPNRAQRRAARKRGKR